ncbi:MAG: dihydropteroate synthase [Dehalococcoidia bacterium]|nr:dihydropteroate synthase [Dehalococcoidia bacterium]
MTFHWGRRTYIMGIINLSPDSFAGDGLDDVEAVVRQAKRMAREGVDILDVGAESTRPGSRPISVDEELGRLIPVLERLREELTLPLSIDTYKLKVAREALDVGAVMLNDIWGLKQGPEMAELAAQRDVPIILMSNQRDISPHHDVIFPDIISVVRTDLKRAIQQALIVGVPVENIIIDPGIGFGKTQEQNLEVLRRLKEFRDLGSPVLLACSRKSIIGRVLNLPPAQSLEGTMAAVAIGIANGADIVRIHDVKEIVRVCKVSDAVIRWGAFHEGR